MAHERDLNARGNYKWGFFSAEELHKVYGLHFKEIYDVASSGYRAVKVGQYTINFYKGMLAYIYHNQQYKRDKKFPKQGGVKSI